MAAADTIALKRYQWPQTVIMRFTTRRFLLGCVLFGLFAGFENMVQAFGIVAAYPHAAERAKVVHDLASNPALGMLYGDAHANIATPAGYMVYRTIAFLGLLAAIWALMFITKMLRGQEEDGRWELLLTGATSARRATADTLLGAGFGLVVSYVVIVAVIAAAGASSKLQVSLASSLFYGLALIAGAATFLAIGAVTSQLAATRRRAVLYGVIPLVAFYALRGIGNVVDSLAWLKNLTPFGWIDKLHPLVNPQPVWLLPIAAFIAFCVVVALVIAGGRDMGESMIADTDTAKPRLRLLNSQFSFDFRMNRAVLFGWLLGAVALSCLMAGIAKTAAQSLSDSGALSKAVAKLSGGQTNTIETAFLGMAGYFVAVLLMFMVVSGLGSVRNEEGQGRLDNFLTAPIARSRWLLARLAILAAAAVIICFVSDVGVWVVAAAQGISVDAPKLLFGGLNVLGPAFALLGFGVLMYGIKPRLAVALMYIWIAWSFTIDILASVVNFDKLALNTSLLHHISLVPAADPKWRTFAILTAGGVSLALIGLWCFSRRDLEAE